MFILSGLFEAVNFLTVFKFRGLDYRFALDLRSREVPKGLSCFRRNDKGGMNYRHLCSRQRHASTNAQTKAYGNNKKDLVKSIKYFPLAGFLIGIMLALVFYAFNSFLPVSPAILISIFFLYIITGGLHFDGLSDTSDGFFAYLKSGDKDRFYKAMKDVNAGTAGNLAVIFYVLIMWSLMASVNPAQSFNPGGGIVPVSIPHFNLIYLILLTFPVAGRYSIVVMSYFSNTPDNFKGIGTVFTEGTDMRSLIAASVFAFIIIYFFLNLAGIFSLLVTVLTVLLTAFYFGKRFGGVNGDMLGFTVKLSEAVFAAALIGFGRILY